MPCALNLKDCSAADVASPRIASLVSGIATCQGRARQGLFFLSAAVISPRLFEKKRAEVLGAPLLELEDEPETDGGVHQLIAHRVHDFSQSSKGPSRKSTGFCWTSCARR